MPNIIHITDFSAPELDIFARKTENQLLNREHPAEGIFIAESPKVVERALDAGYAPVSVLVEDRHIEGEARGILERVGDAPVYTASFEVLKQLTGFPLTRGVLCAMRRKALPLLSETLAGATRIAVLENVMNPTNVGAIFRSAAALGMDAVLLTPGSSNPLYRRAIRVSMGTVFQAYSDGRMAVLTHSVLGRSDRHGIFYGEKGYIVVDCINNPQRICAYDTADGLLAEYTIPEKICGYEYEFLEAARCIRAGKTESDSMPLDHTVRLMELMDELRAQWGLVYPQEK